MFDRGKEQVQRLAKETLKLVLDNKFRVKTGDDYKKTVQSLYDQKTPLTPNQLSYVDGLYEKYMKLAGFNSVGVKHDIKKSW